MAVDPNLLSLLIGGGRFPTRQNSSGQTMLPQFSGGAGMDPNLGALLLATGQLPRHQDTMGRYMLPNATPQSGLNPTFERLDAYAAYRNDPQRNPRYAQPSFAIGQNDPNRYPGSTAGTTVGGGAFGATVPSRPTLPPTTGGAWGAPNGSMQQQIINAIRGNRSMNSLNRRYNG